MARETTPQIRPVTPRHSRTSRVPGFNEIGGVGFRTSPAAGSTLRDFSLRMIDLERAPSARCGSGGHRHSAYCACHEATHAMLLPIRRLHHVFDAGALRLTEESQHALLLGDAPFALCLSRLRRFCDGWGSGVLPRLCFSPLARGVGTVRLDLVEVSIVAVDMMSGSVGSRRRD